MEPITQTIVLAPVSTQAPTQGASIVAGLNPWVTGIIVILAFACLMVSLYLVYNYVNKIRLSAIHTQLLSDAVYESRRRRLLRKYGLDEEGKPVDPQPWDERELQASERELKRITAELERKHLELVGLRGQLESASGAQQTVLNEEIDLIESEIKGLEDQLSWELTPDQIMDLRKQREKWEVEHKKLLDDLNNRAAKETDQLVPETLTIAGMGITSSFFIELTAILTIIFGIIILGILGVLGTQEIAPILAAIAGYVLGKTTSGWAPYGREAGQAQAPRLSQLDTETPEA